MRMTTGVGLAQTDALQYLGHFALARGPVEQVVKKPRHPYTKGLMGSIPVVGGGLKRLTQIDGAMPRLTDLPSGCAFHPRCPKATEACTRVKPSAVKVDNGQVACLLYEGAQ